MTDSRPPLASWLIDITPPYVRMISRGSQQAGRHRSVKGDAGRSFFCASNWTDKDSTYQTQRLLMKRGQPWRGTVPFFCSEAKTSQPSYSLCRSLSSATEHRLKWAMPGFVGSAWVWTPPPPPLMVCLWYPAVKKKPCGSWQADIWIPCVCSVSRADAKTIKYQHRIDSCEYKNRDSCEVGCLCSSF